MSGSTLEARKSKEELRDAPRAKVLRYMRERILGGTFEPGQLLPAGRELSRLLGVSVGTVNTALNELQDSGLLHSNGGKLRYVTPLVRDNFLLQRTFVLIGQPYVDVVHHAPGWKDWLDRSVIDSARQSGMHCLVYCLDNLDDDWSRLLKAQPLGVLVNELINNEWPAFYRMLQTHQNPPLTVFGNEPGMEQYDRIVSNHEIGGYEVVQHLINAGRKRIAMIGPADNEDKYWFVERRAGYERALLEAGLTPLPTIAPPFSHALRTRIREQFDEQVRQLVGHLAEPLLAQKVDAIVALSDGNIPALAQACQTLQRVPNEDVALAGFDNYWIDCPERQFNDTPPVVTVDKRYYESGKQMFQLLQARINNQLPPEPQKVLVRPELVVLPA